MKALTCVILGDVNIDYIADISHVTLGDLGNACIYSDISSNIGGNGAFFAEAAQEAGFNSIRLICSLGNDVAGESIKSYFEQKNVKLINIPNVGETGKVIILYQPDDKRILIADRGTNEKIFSSLYSNMTKFITLPTDLFYISGYSLLNDDQKISLSSIVQRYGYEGTFSVIDAVPHEIFNTFQWNEYVARCQGIDGIVIELSTVSGFMKQNPKSVDMDCVADFLLKSFRFCLVRLNSESDFLIADRFNRRIERIYYEPRVASLRFTDRVTAQVILRYINDPQSIFSTSKWAEEINKIIGGVS